MMKPEMLSELLQQLDEINAGVKDCLYTLQENAEVTRQVIKEILTGAQESPMMEYNDRVLRDMIDEVNKIPATIMPDNMKVEELNIFDEDFEEKVLEKKKKISSKLKKTTISGPGGIPIDVFELEMGEDMSQEERINELAKHMKDIQNMYNSKRDEDTDYGQAWT